MSADLLAQAGGCTLWVEPYSRPLFPQEAEHIRAAEEPWTQAGPEDLCFLELTGPAPALERADRLILYRWNRHYPSDRKLAPAPGGLDPNRPDGIFRPLPRRDYKGDLPAMKRIQQISLSLFLLLCLLLSACGALPAGTQASFSLEDIPEFSGEPYVVLEDTSPASPRRS